MRRRDPLVPLVALLVVMAGSWMVADGVQNLAASESRCEPAPSSVVGGMGMPGRNGSGLKWNRLEGVQDEQ